jgi:hypothetical protein
MNKLLSPPLLFRIVTMLVVAVTVAGLAFSAASASIDGGGGTSTGDSYSLMGTIGQPDAGSNSGTGYDLTGGFWAWMWRYLGYLPLIKRP